MSTLPFFAGDANLLAQGEERGEPDDPRRFRTLGEKLNAAVAESALLGSAMGFYYGAQAKGAGG